MKSSETSEDPIVDEVRRIRAEYAAEFNYDLDAICEDLKRRTEQAAREGKKVISLPPRRPEGWVEPSKKAG